MKTKNGFSFFATILLPLVLAAGASSARADDRVDVVSSKGFAATVKNLEKVIKSEGMMIVATIDHQNMLKMVGASIKGAKTLEFGKPDMGKMLLPMAPQVGLEMPGKIYVWEREDGKTVVSYRKVGSIYGSYGNQMISEAGGMMDIMVGKMVEAAAK